MFSTEDSKGRCPLLEAFQSLFLLQAPQAPGIIVQETCNQSIPTVIFCSATGEVLRKSVSSLATMSTSIFVSIVLLCADISHSFKPVLAKPKFVSSKSDGRSLNMMSGNTEGRLLTVDDIASDGRSYLNLGMPRVLPPGQADEDWLLWFHARDDQLADDVVKLSTGRILFASSKDGLSGWKFHEDSPVLNPNKENDGDWYFFDSEHVGLGDVIQPGEKANEKFATQVPGVKLCMYNNALDQRLNNNSRWHIFVLKIS